MFFAGLGQLLTARLKPSALEKYLARVRVCVHYIVSLGWRFLTSLAPATWAARAGKGEGYWFSVFSTPRMMRLRVRSFMTPTRIRLELGARIGSVFCLTFLYF